MKKLVTWAVVVAIAVGGVSGLVQGSAKFRKLAGQYVSGLTKGTESAPARIQNFEEQLQNNLQSFVQMREKVQTQLSEQGQIHRERDNELLGVQSLLSRFKDEYGVGCGPGGFPRMILGRSYSKEAVEEQVELLLKRRDELEEKATHYASVTEKLQKSLSELDQRIGTTKTHLESMPTYLTLVETHTLTGQADQAVAGLESCLESNQALLGKTIRDSSELLKADQAEKKTSLQRATAKQFLIPAPAAPAQASVPSAPVATPKPATPSVVVPTPTPLQQVVTPDVPAPPAESAPAPSPVAAETVHCPTAPHETLSALKTFLQSQPPAVTN